MSMVLICDLCKEILENKESFDFYLPFRKYDLCNKCYEKVSIIRSEYQEKYNEVEKQILKVNNTYKKELEKIGLKGVKI